jgi:signal transduction histidine kinase
MGHTEADEQVPGGDGRQRVGAQRAAGQAELPHAAGGRIQARDAVGAQLGAFAAAASHELRTPLTIVTGDLDVLRRQGILPAEADTILQDVDDELLRLSNLVEDLLTLARADSGEEENARDLVGFDVVIGEVVQRLRRLADAQGLAFNAELECVQGSTVSWRDSPATSLHASRYELNCPSSCSSSSTVPSGSSHSSHDHAWVSGPEYGSR